MTYLDQVTSTYAMGIGDSSWTIAYNFLGETLEKCVAYLITEQGVRIPLKNHLSQECLDELFDKLDWGFEINNDNR